jgi:hypothetical protein
VHLIKSNRRPDGGEDRGGPGLATTATTAGAAEAGTLAAADGSRRFAGRLPWLLWAGGLLLVGAGLFTLYVRQSSIGPLNSDGASITLQAQAMLHGNPLLKGWWTADVSFYTTELPEYMLVELFRGVRPDVVHIAGALGYTLAVLLAALLARGSARGRAGIIRALLAAGIMLAPSIIGGTEVFLENPDHAGTAVPILALLLLLDRAPERWYVPVLVCAALAWIQVGDLLTLVAVTAPIAAVAVIRMIMLAVRRRPLSEYRYDAMLLVAAGLSTQVAKLVQAMLRRLGGFDLRPLPHQLLAPFSQVPAHTRTMGQTLMLLFGANNLGTARQPLEIIAWLHVIGLALALLGFAVAVVTFFMSRTDRVTQIVVAGTVATLVAGIFGTELYELSHAHEVAILLPFGAVLAGRMLPPLVSALLPGRWRAGRVGVPLLAAWLAAGLAALCYAATWAPMGTPNQQLADWLSGHGYTEGLATYWQANETTVASDGKVLVAPITPSARSVRRWESSIGWYDPTSRQANFVIAMSDPNSGLGGLSTATVRKSFGRPAHQYQVEGYVVMVYDYNLLTRLKGRVFPGVEPPNR